MPTNNYFSTYSQLTISHTAVVMYEEGQGRIASER